MRRVLYERIPTPTDPNTAPKLAKKPAPVAKDAPAKEPVETPEIAPKTLPKAAVPAKEPVKAISKAKASGKSHKPASASYGISKESNQYIKDQIAPLSPKIMAFNVAPQSFVSPSDIEFNPELNKDNVDAVWICKFPSKDKEGNTIIKTAYTAQCMINAQKKKYEKISGFKKSDLDALENNTAKLLNSDHQQVSDAACIIRIILKTGLRPGSKDTGTGNLGVCTLKVRNVTFKGNIVKFKFIGKSYQENVAQLDDPAIVSYLQKAVAGKKPSADLFNVSYSTVKKIMAEINPKGINPKDLRTYKATEYAKKLLADTKLTGAPPPLPKDPKKITALVREKLKKVFELTAKVLNNEPAMAKNSYVNPIVIKSFLDDLGLVPKAVGYKHSAMAEGFDINKDVKLSSLDEMFERYRLKTPLKESELLHEVDEDEDLDSEEFPIPSWLFDPKVLLVPKNM